MEEIRVVQIEEIHRQIRRQICRDVSPAARLMVVIQAKHDGESWKVKLQKNLKKENFDRHNDHNSIDGEPIARDAAQQREMVT